MTTTTFTLTVTSASAPAWWATATPGEWTPIASLGIVNAEDPDISYIYDGSNYINGWGTQFSNFSITNQYAGACFDTDRNELLIVAAGGHGDYAGNEALSLPLMADAPQWVRLNNRSQVVVNTLPDPYVPATFPDGRCRAMHHGGRSVYAGGKVRFGIQGSVTGPSASTLCHAVFDRSALPAGTDVLSGAASPVAWANNAGPWTLFPPPSNLPTGLQGTYMGYPGYDVYSPRNGYVYSFNNTNGAAIFRRDLAANGEWKVFPVVSTNSNSSAFAVLLPMANEDLILFAGLLQDGTPVFNLFEPAQWNAAYPGTAAWRTVTISGYVPFTASAAMYREADHSIYVVNSGVSQSVQPTGTLGNWITKITVPVNGDGTYNHAGTWTASTIKPTGTEAGETSGTGPYNAALVQGFFNKAHLFQIDGGDAIIAVASDTEPAYVYRF